MKKTLALILLLSLCICALASCNLIHEHVSSGWEYDEIYHYSLISCNWNRCDIEPYLGAHVFDGDICEICGYERVESAGYEVTVSYAGVRPTLSAGGLNSDKLSISGVRHLPIYKFDTYGEFYSFVQSLGEPSLVEDYAEILSFASATARYDEAFFAENTLMLVYVSASSGSYRYDVNSVFLEGEALCIHVEQTNDPDIVTNDITGWFITVAIPDTALGYCTEFDADLNNIEK